MRFAKFFAAVAIAVAPEASFASQERQHSKEHLQKVSISSTEGFLMAEIKGAEGFGEWLSAFKRRARSQGISDRVIEQGLAGISYDVGIIEKDRNQSEFTKQIWEYLDSAASDARVANGKMAIAENQIILDRIEAKYGVEKEIVAAVWGLESAYGTFRGNIPTLQALASLSYDARRSDFFEAQLIAALKILQSGDVPAANMTGSWAGAMGHTQFMPTSYLDYAVDFMGDGKRDIWSDDPTDALASTAAYLRSFGWTTGQPWGVEVTLPDGFAYDLATDRFKKPASVWASFGVRDTRGGIVPNYGLSSILLPAGANGAVFMIFNNFHVLERYNKADAYVIGVGHLADRIVGGRAIVAEWPREDRPLRFVEKIQMQELLTAAGFDTFGSDGIIGPNTISAIKAFQDSIGVIPDGYASARILEELKKLG